jgi:hypothetical protein
MLEVIQSKNHDTNKIDKFHEVLSHDNHDSNTPVIPVSCESNEPIVE